MDQLNKLSTGPEAIKNKSASQDKTENSISAIKFSQEESEKKLQITQDKELKGVNCRQTTDS
jgi:hypothetical protein